LTGLLLIALLAQAKVTQHMILVEPSGTDLAVSETLLVEGKGSFKVFIPPDADLAPVRGARAVKSGAPGTYELTPEGDGPELRVDLNWTMPFVVPESWSGRILHGGGPVRMVFPKGVTATSAALEPNGVEPTTQASIFSVKANVSAYKVSIDGAGQLRRNAPAEPAGEDNAPSIEIIQPRIYERKYVILGLILGVLAVGFVLNFRATAKG
jgi:hypothetical protein